MTLAGMAATAAEHDAKRRGRGKKEPMSLNGLCLARGTGEYAVIDLRDYGLGLIRVGVLPPTRFGKPRIIIDADRRIPVHRSEVFEAIEKSKESPP